MLLLMMMTGSRLICVCSDDLEWPWNKALREGPAIIFRLMTVCRPTSFELEQQIQHRSTWWGAKRVSSNGVRYPPHPPGSWHQCTPTFEIPPTYAYNLWRRTTGHVADGGVRPLGTGAGPNTRKLLYMGPLSMKMFDLQRPRPNLPG